MARLVHRCSDHPSYDGTKPPSAMGCPVCLIVRERAELYRKAAETDNWLERQLLRASAEMLAWPEWKQQAFRREAK
jgi:hypothetical protein